jgi:outer membrane protein OmpA-like peptidoglycan-associated protein
LAGSTLIAALAVGATTHAQFALDRFQPAPAGDRFFGVQGGDPGGDLSPRLMLLGDYAYKPLVLYRASDNQAIGNVVSNQLIVHAAAGISLWDRLWVFANMPLALYANGQSPSDGGVQLLSPSGVAAGDLRAGMRLRLLGENRSLASLSLSAYVFIPTGKKDKYTSSGEVHGMPALVLSGEGDSVAYAINAGVDVQKKNDIFAPGVVSTALGSELTFGAAVALLLADRMLQIGPEVYGTTVMVGSDRFSKATTSVEGILGARLRVGDIVLGLGAGPGITRGLGTPTLRAVASLAYAPLPPPLPPPPPPPPVRKKPVPPPDRDKDGIYDKVDACPDEPGVKSDDPEKNGCPPPPPDRDGDGILDRDDACPDLKGVKSDDPTQNGCPPDTDGDGIRDDVDACPNEKGKPDPDPQKNGCPTSVRVTDQEIIILEQVQFKTGSAVILKASDDLLFQVAVVLAEHPEIIKLEVQGHTDNRGGKKYNKKLSDKRAAAVVKWMVKRGSIDASRLSSHGYGMDEPITDNDTPEGRQKNRRVQFKIVEKTSKKNEVSP